MKVPTIIVYDVATKVLDTEIFPHHTVADLNLWHYIYCFVQSGEAFTVKGNKHADTHTHTHTLDHLLLFRRISINKVRFQNFLQGFVKQPELVYSVRKSIHSKKHVRLNLASLE